MKLITALIGVSASAAIALAGGSTTVVDFEDGLTHGWEGPQGFGGATMIDNTYGVGGGAGFRTQFNDFGIAFTNSTNANFTGDYTQFDEVTISVDLRIDQIGFEGLGITRPFMLELRSHDLGDDGYPWASAFFLFDWVGADSFTGYQTFSATIDTSASDLPVGWGGYGSFDPNTFESILPDGVNFSDILANVDEIAFSTLLPDFFFTNDDYDMTIDNVTITTIPVPGALAVLSIGGLVGTRRRR